MNIKAAAGAFVAAVSVMAGCGGDGAEEIEQRQQALIPGNWGNHNNGVVVGSGGSIGNLMVCRAYFDGGEHPGKVWENQCLYGWGGQEKKTWSFDKLLDDGYSWFNPGRWEAGRWVFPLPSNAVDGGSAGHAGNFTRMGVCQVRRANGWHPGKWYAEHCNYGYAGQEMRAQPLPNDPGDFVQVLVKR